MLYGVSGAIIRMMTFLEMKKEAANGAHSHARTDLSHRGCEQPLSPEACHGRSRGNPVLLRFL